jgi:hypothetical protein
MILSSGSFMPHAHYGDLSTFIEIHAICQFNGIEHTRETIDAQGG